MSRIHEVEKPIISSPYDEPTCHYLIESGKPAQLVQGRRPAMYYYRPPQRQTATGPSDEVGTAIELTLVNELRKRVAEWRKAGYPGITRTTDELLRYWHRPEREGVQRLFFCQREAAETIIFLVEAREDLRQGLELPRDEPGEEGRAKGYTGFTRYACKMATATGKTTVMAMLAAWSILNKVNNRSDGRFSDVALALCPNVTIRDRLGELDPQRGEQSLYRTRDLVPAHLMDSLRRGKVIATNWHVLEPKELNKVGSDSSRVVRRGEPKRVNVTKTIDGKKTEVTEIRCFQSDGALVRYVLGRHGVGGKQNILVLNDEGHHAYRLRPKPKEAPDEEAQDDADDEEIERAVKEATVWVDGLDKIHKLRGINFCVDLSATPYYLNQTGNDPGRPFPWIVCDFGLVDAIESGLVKIPQLPIQDTTGKEIPAYFNVWKWIVEEKLTRAEKGGRRGQISPKAVLRYAQVPFAMLAGLWRETFEQWKKEPEIHPTPPVFVIVCRDTKLARVVFEWIAEGKGDTAAPIAEFLNRHDQLNTVRVDSKVIEEIESGETKSLETRRMRFILETVGKTHWPNHKPPQDWIAIADELNVDPLIPPGRDIHCIVSVQMLTEGWDATTVTHIAGLRPFQSQLLCEQVVGRALRRSQYQDLSVEEDAKIYGVPFEVIPFKTTPGQAPPPPPTLHHVYALSDKEHLAIRFPRVERYTFAVKSRIRLAWDRVPSLTLDPMHIPPEVTTRGLSWIIAGRPSLLGPGRIGRDELREWCEGKRLQELEFELTRTLTRAFVQSPKCEIPAHILFPRLLNIVKQFVQTKITPLEGYDRRAVFLDPFWGWAVETLNENLVPDETTGEAPELPVYETHRGPGSSADVDFWTAKRVWEVAKSHVNCLVADTRQWEQTAAWYLDSHENVLSFVKNAGLAFAIPYMHEGDRHEYEPDFLVRLSWEGREVGTLILETKGPETRIVDVKKAAALRWVAAVNNDGRYGLWDYRLLFQPSAVREAVRESAKHLLSLKESTD